MRLRALLWESTKILRNAPKMGEFDLHVPNIVGPRNKYCDSGFLSIGNRDFQAFSG